MTVDHRKDKGNVMHPKPDLGENSAGWKPRVGMTQMRLIFKADD